MKAEKNGPAQPQRRADEIPFPIAPFLAAITRLRPVQQKFSRRAKTAKRATEILPSSPFAPFASFARHILFSVPPLRILSRDQKLTHEKHLHPF
jgi:hypothetical protein